MKHIIISMAVLSTFGVYAQKKNKETSNAEPANLSKVVFENALKYGDGFTAINALHEIIAKEGAQSTYKDSLAFLYYRANNFSSAHLVAKELLIQKPQDEKLLEINAFSLSALGASKEAIDGFEKLLLVSKNRYHAYELAKLQYGISRMAESLVTINQAMVNTKESDVKVVFNIDKERQQEVPLNAAIMNLKGIVAFEMKDEKAALESFDEALKIMPDFAMAQLNKKTVEEKKAQ